MLHAKNAGARSGQQAGKHWRVRGRAAVCDLYCYVEKQLIAAIVSREVESRSSAIFACRSRVIGCENLIHFFLGQFFSVGFLEKADQFVNLTELIV